MLIIIIITLPTTKDLRKSYHYTIVWASFVHGPPMEEKKRLALSCWLWWSQGTVLASRSKVRRFKPGWGRWIFQDIKILSTSLLGGNLSWGSWVWDFRLVKEPQAWKIVFWAKCNRHIHVLVSKFREQNRSLKGLSAMGSNDHLINAIQYNVAY